MKAHEAEITEMEKFIESVCTQYDVPRNVAREFGEDVEADEDTFGDCYLGAHKTLREWAQQTLDNEGFFDVWYILHDKQANNMVKAQLEMIKIYFDYESYAKDRVLSGDIFVIDGTDGLYYIFYSN